MKIVVAIIIALFVASTSLAQTDEQPLPQGFPLAITVQCDTVERMTQVLSSNYKEQPIATGTGMMVTNGQALTGTMMLWGSIESKTYSITLDNSKMMCMILSGKQFAPAKSSGEPT